MEHGLHLVRVHGHTAHRDHVAEIVDGRRAERTLGALNEESMQAQNGEDSLNVALVLSPGC
jgi:hypothetical protein